MDRKRVYIACMAIMSVFILGIVTLYMASMNTEYVAVVSNQSEREYELYETRGTIYDRDLERLTNDETNILAVALPVPQNLKSIEENTDIPYEDITTAITPILYNVEKEIPSDFIDYFEVFDRYSENPVATHLVGYVDSANNGVVGAEKAFNNVLNSEQGRLLITYSTNALGNVIVGKDRYYTNTLTDNNSGIALTIDKDIQQFVEEVASKLTKGAVVVSDVNTGEIIATTSVPNYNQNDILSAMEDENSPLVNRAFEAYSPGSIFKLVVATTAMHDEELAQTEHFCTGSIMVNGKEVTCYGSATHGLVDMNDAIVNSCNTYFINLALNMDTELILNQAITLGFKKSTDFYEGTSSVKGNLPSNDNLDSDRAIANFSIGQGEILVTPVQVAAMINTVANGGFYRELSLYEGEVDENMNLLDNTEEKTPVRVIDEFVCYQLQDYMENTAKYGTGINSAPSTGICGIKTGTAETGVFTEDGEELTHIWNAGYVGKYRPEYSVVVFSESLLKSDSKVVTVFNEISEYLVNFD